MTAQAFTWTRSTKGRIPAAGTQFDALGHFAALRQPWDGKIGLPAIKSFITAASPSSR